MEHNITSLGDLDGAAQFQGTQQTVSRNAANSNEMSPGRVDDLVKGQADHSAPIERNAQGPARASELPTAHKLRRQIAATKSRVCAFPSSSAGKPRSWWKQLSTWISIVATFVTVVTATLQFRFDSSQADLGQEQRDLQKQQGIIAEEAELSHIFEQIGIAQSDLVAANRQGVTTDDRVTEIKNAQLALWANKASEIIDNRAEATNAAEYHMLATAYEYMGPTTRVIHYLESAMLKAEEFRTYSAVGQDLGDNFYRRGEPAEAEHVFKRLVAPHQNPLFEAAQPAIALDQIVSSRSAWATQLRVLGQCTKRRTQLRKAEINLRAITNLGGTSANVRMLRNEAAFRCAQSSQR